MSTIQRVLVTGGAGYIGSHTCVRLIEAGIEPLVFDNFANSRPAVLDRIARLTGKRPLLVEGDVRDRELLAATLARHPVQAAIHFAGLKAVGESVREPLAYYDVNVHGSLVLAEALHAAGVRTLVFSSSATVYGSPERVPVDESAPTGPTNPYGRSKRMVEQVLTDLVAANADWSATLLRYFNPVGAHESGLIGEDPRGEPNNLMPYIAQVAAGQRERLSVFGTDYPTPDGTGVRDYIHVMDLADGHLAALRHTHGRAGLHCYNLGTGRGHSVLEVVAAFERACGFALSRVNAPRRAGDVAACWADPAHAERELGWRATTQLASMCEDTWRWQSRNPNGYDDTAT